MTKTNSSQQHSNSKVTTSDPMDIWSSILNQKNKDEASQSKTSPYIHPLVKKSKSYLSEKSLEICTESLGSETGSDGFSSSYTPSSSSSQDTNSEDDEKLKETVNMVVKKPRCFPPPLSSLTSQTQQLQMSPHRDNGRLFLSLQVASVPSQSHNSFISTRQNGRLVLTFANHDDEEIPDENESVTKQPRARSLELAVNKEIGLVNKSPTWSEKFNKVTNFEDVKTLQHGQYCEHQNSNRNKVVVYGNINIYQGSNEATQYSQQLFVQNMKLCNDSRTTMSFLFWDPCCIAT